MSTPQRPMARTSNGCLVLNVSLPNVSEGLGDRLRIESAPSHSALSILCPDILSFDHAVLPCSYCSSGPTRDRRRRAPDGGARQIQPCPPLLSARSGHRGCDP